MSIEKDLGRIADALEQLVALKEAPLAKTITTMANTETKNIKVEAPIVEPVIAPVAADGLPNTVDELRALAQEIAAKCTDVSAFTTYVRNEICARAGVKKLGDIPSTMIKDAARDLLKYQIK